MKQSVESFFEEFLETPSIFKDKSVFQPNFNPNQFSHRDTQIAQIASILAPTLRNQKASNLFIYGKTGTGKTLSVFHVVQNLEKLAKDRSLSLTMLSVNCKLRRVADTEYRLIGELARLLDQEIPPTGLPTEEVYHSFISALESRKHTIILILDEIDHLVAKAGSGILYNLTRLNSQLHQSQISLVGISNDAMFTEGLDPRVKSSLSEEELVFPPYNALQIQDILQERSLLAFHKGTLESGVIEKCAAFAAREHGDARRAIELLRIAGELAERSKSTAVSLHHMDQAKDKLERDRIEELVSSYPKQYQGVLLGIIRLHTHRKGFLFTGEVYDVYARICSRAGLRPLTQRRVSDIIAEFDMVGIINAKIISKGRYGRTREISISLDTAVQERIQIILEQSLDVSAPKTIQPSIQPSVEATDSSIQNSTSNPANNQNTNQPKDCVITEHKQKK